MQNVEPTKTGAKQKNTVGRRRPSLLQDLFWWFTHLVCSLSFSLLWSLRTRGGARIPKKGPVLVIANHQSFLDPVVIGVASHRPLAYLARKDLFNNAFFSWLIRALRAVPIDQEGSAVGGIRAVLNLLRDGEAVVIFPEGERSEHGDVIPLKPGIHLLLKRAKVPVVPVGVAGAYQAWPRWRKLPHAAPLVLPPADGTIGVSVGEPIDANSLSELQRDELLKFLFDEIYQQYTIAENLRRKN